MKFLSRLMIIPFRNHVFRHGWLFARLKSVKFTFGASSHSSLPFVLVCGSPLPLSQPSTPVLPVTTFHCHLRMCVLILMFSKIICILSLNSNSGMTAYSFNQYILREEEKFFVVLFFRRRKRRERWKGLLGL